MSLSLVPLHQWFDDTRVSAHVCSSCNWALQVIWHRHILTAKVTLYGYCIRTEEWTRAALMSWTTRHIGTPRSIRRGGP